VPENGILHEGDTFALRGMCNQATGPAFLEGQRGQKRRERRYVVPVRLLNGPSKGLPLIRERLQRQCLVYGGDALDLVVVHDRRQVVQLMVWGEEDWFPR